VARFADACNLWPTPEVPHKLKVLRAHCEAVGRDYDAIEKTAMLQMDVGENGEKVEALIGQLRWLASMGIQTVVGGVKDVWRIKPLEVLGERVVPAVAGLEATPAVSS
jgi:alkanesulfonate monooxygenase SsuD/methylene tetrahydromethanopterin reductase-like flavin-dependent oxidoreductase (luciferase family)